MAGIKPSVFRFADLEVREREFSLAKAGEIAQVEPKAFRVLLFLLHNPQKLITKEELLDAVWGETAVSENSLTRSIALLRHLLNDDPHQPRFIETVATVGYRFVCPVEVVEDAHGGLEAADPPEVPSELAANDKAAAVEAAPAKAAGRANWILTQRWPAAAVVVFVGFLASAVWYLHRPLPPPHVTAYTQITHDGHEKELAGTDGSRLYFSQLSPNFIAQVGITGGEVARIPVAEQEHYRLYPRDVSPDGSSLLIFAEQDVATSAQEMASLSLWNVRILGGTVRSLGTARQAAFSPDGNSIVYSTQEGDIWLVRSDGTGAHKLAPAVGRILNLAWSPDASAIRFTRDGKLWEISSNGSGLHQLLPDWQSSSRKWSGRWTPDGSFYVFLSRESNLAYQIWALDERHGLLRRPPPDPVQLTSGPISWNRPVPSKDGKTIFAEGRTNRGELTRFDPHTIQSQPFLGGISAEFISFSTDGKSVAYVSYPDGILWKANRDGSNPVQLTAPPLYPMNPRWSPDGNKILFMAGFLEGFSSIFAVSSQGGTPKRLLPEDPEQQYDPNWSPDGSKIVFCEGYFRDRKKVHMSILDLASNQVTPVPGSVGKWSPRWSPDGRYLATLSWELPELKIYGFKTGRWSTLPLDGDINYPAWSHDSQFIYSLVITPGGQEIYRNRVTGDKAERIVDLKDWHFTGYGAYAVTLDPTDAPLFLRDIGSSDIYALTFEEK